MNTENEFRAEVGQRNICNAYYAGMLQANLRLIPCQNIPGLTITDPKAFKAWVEQELESCMAKSEIWQKRNDKPVDTEPMV